MLFVVYALDNPTTGKEIRRRTRVAHLRFVADNQHLFRYGGALLDDDGGMIGTLAIIEAADCAALEHFLRDDPYNQENLFERVIITQTRQVLPEVSPGFIAAELARATAGA